METFTHNDLVKNKYAINDALLFDAEGPLDNPSTFFYSDDDEVAMRRRDQRRQTRAGMMLVVAAVTIGGGIIAVFNLSRVLHTLIG